MSVPLRNNLRLTLTAEDFDPTYGTLRVAGTEVVLCGDCAYFTGIEAEGAQVRGGIKFCSTCASACRSASQPSSSTMADVVRNLPHAEFMKLAKAVTTEMARREVAKR